MNKLILLISDDVGTDRALRVAFTRTAPDYDVEIAAHRQNISTLRTPAVILLDLMLLSEPAFDVLRWLRTEKRYAGVPVFVLGSEIVDHEVTEAYTLGANACLLNSAFADSIEPVAHGIATYASLLPTTDCTCLESAS